MVSHIERAFQRGSQKCYFDLDKSFISTAALSTKFVVLSVRDKRFCWPFLNKKRKVVCLGLDDFNMASSGYAVSSRESEKTHDNSSVILPSTALIASLHTSRV